MKLKIFNKAVFTLICVMAAGIAVAQQRTDSVKGAVIMPPGQLMPLQVKPLSPVFGRALTMAVFPQDSAYRKEYRKLQEQMTELRKKMNGLQMDEMRKNADLMRKKAQEMRELSRQNNNKAFDNLRKNFNYNFEDNVSGESKGLGIAPAGRGFYFNGGKGDDYLKKKIESGEVKEKTRSYTKSYSVDKNDAIMIDNHYGKIVVNTWAKNEVKVDVQIKADADNDAAAQNLLDAVRIDDSKTADGITFKTVNRASFNSGTRFNTLRTEVNYVVYMPVKNSLVITNSYGSVKIPDLSGKIKLNLTYGTLNARQLTNPLNELKVTYGDANIQLLNSTAMNISYGKLNIGTADNLKAKLNFSTGNVDELQSSGDISVNYGGGLKIGRLSNVKNLNVNAAFARVLVNVKDDYNFDVNTHNANFTYGDNGAVKVTETAPAEGTRGYSSTKNYKGRVGKGSTDKTITIRSSYGGVKFYEL